MKVTPVASPHAIQTPQTTANNSETRAKVIAKIEAIRSGQPVQMPVQNQNAVAPEEMRAIKPQEALTQAAETAQDSATSTPVEASQPEETPAESQKPQVDPALTKQFAMLARQEKALRAKAQQQEQALKAKEQALAEKEAAIKTLEQQYQQGYVPKEQIKTNALQVLADAGVSYDELTQQILNQSPENPRIVAEINNLKAETKRLQEIIDRSQKAMEEKSTSDYQAAVKQIKADAKALVNSDPTFETIKTTNSVNDVVELIERTFKEEGRIMSVEEAAQEVEDYLVGKLEKIYTNTNKIKQRLAQASAQNQAKTQQKQPAAAAPQQPQMKTLTNAAASTRKLTAKERAILAFKGELKS